MVTLTLLHPQNQTPLKQWRFAMPMPITVGRSHQNHVVLKDIIVSRSHLELQRLSHTTPMEVWQLDSRGGNGTFVNGILVSQTRLADGDIIQLGLTGPRLRFQLEPSAFKRSDAQAVRSQRVNRQPMPTIHQCTHSGAQSGNLFCIHCGQPLQVLRRVRDYQVLKVLAQGGMGTIFLVQTLTPSNQHAPLRALKQMNADMIAIPKAQELFEREARVLRSLCYPGIPRLFDAFVEHNRHYLVMELIHGRNLDQWVRQHGPIPPQQAIDWMVQVCEILTYLHHRQPPVIHRDLKPSNILVRPRDQKVFVVDFGAVKEATAPPDTRIAVEGYSAPEQGLGRPTLQSDLYAIGATLVFLLTGKGPLQFYRNRDQGYRLTLNTRLSVPSSLKTVIERVTHPHPGSRHQSAVALAQALKHCL